MLRFGNLDYVPKSYLKGNFNHSLKYTREIFVGENILKEESLHLAYFWCFPKILKVATSQGKLQ